MMMQELENNSNQMMEEQIMDKNINISNDNKHNLLFESSHSYKEIMVGSLNKLKYLDIDQSTNSQSMNQKKRERNIETPIREYIQTFSFQNSIYIAYVNGSQIRITKQLYMKVIGGGVQSDYQEFVYKMNENICNQVFFMGVENANNDSQLDNSVIIIIPCANGSISIKQLIQKDTVAAKWELNLECHGQTIYSVGQIYQNNLKQRIEICACLANSKVFSYELDAGSFHDKNLNFIRHISEIKLFDNFINQIYHQRFKSSEDFLLASIIPASRFIILAITKDFRLKVINYKQKQVKFDYPLLSDKETIALLDPFKNIKISTLIKNPIKQQSGLQNSINILISVSFINSSLANWIQLLNLEVIPQEELGQSQSIPDLSLSAGIGIDDNFELTNPLTYCTNVKFAGLTEIFRIHNKSEIVDVSLSQKGIFIASVPSKQNHSLQFLSYETIMNSSLALSLNTIYSADFSIQHQLQQDLEYLESDDSNAAFKEYPLNRLFKPDRFPLKLIHEFFGNYTEFKLQANFLGNADIKKISQQLLMQTDFKFESAMKNSLISLTNNWVKKYSIIGLHIDSKHPDMLPVVIRENGLFNLVPMTFYETFNLKLNEFAYEHTFQQRSQSSFRDHTSKHIPLQKYSEAFIHMNVYQKYSNWCEQYQINNLINHKNLNTCLPEIFELLSWTKLFLLPDILNCLNLCPDKYSFAQSIQIGIQSASNTLSYESLSEQLENILSDEDSKNRIISSMKILLDAILQEIFHKNIYQGNSNIVVKEQPVLINIDFCVWSKNLMNGTIRYRIRELVELSLIILSFFKYLEHRKVKDDCLNNLQEIAKNIGIAYSITHLFDKPLLQIEKMNKLIIKDEDQSLDHIMFLDIISYFISSELTLMYSIAKNENLIKNKIWVDHNSLKIETTLFENLIENKINPNINNNQIPCILKFLQDHHQLDISLCISQFFNQSLAILYSQILCLYEKQQYKKAIALLHKILLLIHINPSLVNHGPWIHEKQYISLHQQFKEKSTLKEDIWFIRHCIYKFFKETSEDLKCQFELAQIGLLLFQKYDDEEEYNLSLQNSKTIECRLNFIKICVQYYLQIQDYNQAFNSIKLINQIQKKNREHKQILDECIKKFVQNLCSHNMIGIISDLVYEDDLALQIEKVINEENRQHLQLIIENYCTEAEKYIYLDNQLSPENLYRFNSSMNFYISIKNYKQAGLSQWMLYNTFKFIANIDDNASSEPISKYLYCKLLNLQIVALQQAQSLFLMAGYDNDIVIYENYKLNQEKWQQNSNEYSKDRIEIELDQENQEYDNNLEIENQPKYLFEINQSTNNKNNQQYQWISVKIIQKIIADLQARLTVEESQYGEVALNVTDSEQIIAYLIEFKKFDQLITYMHELLLDFEDILIYFTEMFYKQDNGYLNEDDEDIDYFELIRRILILNQNQNYMKYSILVLKCYGSCIQDQKQIGEKMKGFAKKINLPKMHTFLFHALSDFGEDQVLAEEIVNAARNELQNINLQQVNKQVHSKQYIPLQLISKVLDNNSAQAVHKQVLMQISSLFQVQ